MTLFKVLNVTTDNVCVNKAGKCLFWLLIVWAGRFTKRHTIPSYGHSFDSCCFYFKVNRLARNISEPRYQCKHGVHNNYSNRNRVHTVFSPQLPRSEFLLSHSSWHTSRATLKRGWYVRFAEQVVTCPLPSLLSYKSALPLLSLSRPLLLSSLSPPTSLSFFFFFIFCHYSHRPYNFTRVFHKTLLLDVSVQFSKKFVYIFHGMMVMNRHWLSSNQWQLAGRCRIKVVCKWFTSYPFKIPIAQECVNE